MSEFRPHPWLRNPHLQTVLGAFLPGKFCPPPQRRLRVELGDGDALLLHENRPRHWQPGQPMTLLVHGLTGCHASTHISRMAESLLALGVRTFRIDLRGAGAGLALARQTYHAGRSHDLRCAIRVMHAESPTSPIWIIAVSLGANMALKLAAEAATDPLPGLQRVAVINPPIDLARCAQLIMLPKNRLYERRFTRDLVRDALRRQRLFPDLPPVNFPRDLTLIGFDDLYTAPRNGFRDAADYYRRASSFPLLGQIKLPTLMVTARDDPFIAIEPFEELKCPPNLILEIQPFGGHVGFVSWEGGIVRWAERRVVHWLVAQ